MKSPRQFWKEKSTFDKIFAAIASLLAIIALVLEPFSFFTEVSSREDDDHRD